MSLGSSFWSSGYEDIKLTPDFSGASVSYTTSGGHTEAEYGPCEQFSFMFTGLSVVTVDGGGDTPVQDKDLEHGYAYALDDMSGDPAFFNSVFFRTARLYDIADGRDAFLPFSFDPAESGRKNIYCIKRGGGTSTASIYIYQPWCWYGLQSEVIGAILRESGVPTSAIDTASFSAVHDEHVALDVQSRPWCFYMRQESVEAGETIKSLARCDHALLAVNMAGQIGLYSRTSPAEANTIYGLDTTDGVKDVQWRMAYEHISNKAVAAHGHYNVCNFEQVSGTIYEPVSVEHVDDLSTFTYRNDFPPFAPTEDADSMLQYGVRELKNASTKLGGVQEAERKIDIYHIPELVWELQSAVGNIRSPLLQLMTRISAVECDPRREVTIKQDLLGLDYDVGYLIEDLEVTADSDTFNAVCIEKTIDFRSMTVTSVLLEEPS